MRRFSLYSSTEFASESNSFAISSSNSGTSLNLNVASLPANSSAWYSSGKVTTTSFSSPVFKPSNCSSNPGINDPEPISRSYFSACPPSNASPSTEPEKSIFTVSPFSTTPSSLTTISAKWLKLWSIDSCNSSSVNSVSCFSISKPL